MANPAGHHMDVVIDSLAYTGKRVARPGEKILFLDRGVPGDRVRVRIDAERKRYLEGTVVEILEPSPDRVEPPCPYYGTCGGCHLQEIRYEKQLFWKFQTVESTLQRLGGFSRVHVMPFVTASPNPFHYRNKVELHFDGSGKEAGPGFYQKNPAKLIRVDQCLILNRRLNRILTGILDFFSRMPPERRALFTRLVIRDGELKPGCLFYTWPGSRQEIKKLLQSFARTMGMEMDVCFTVEKNRPPGIREIIPVKGTGATLHLAGPFRIRADITSFVQVNHWINRKLIYSLREMIGEHRPARAVDAYAGTGNMGLFLSSLCDEIIALEGHAPSVADAHENLRFNRIQNVSVHLTRVGERSGEPLNIAPSPDTLLLDPPRSGCSKRAAEFLASLKAGRIFYISCDPATLARDLKIFNRLAGYSVEKVMVFDMFPQTYHVEMIAEIHLR